MSFSVKCTKKLISWGLGTWHSVLFNKNSIYILITSTSSSTVKCMHNVKVKCPLFYNFCNFFGKTNWYLVVVKLSSCSFMNARLYTRTPDPIKKLTFRYTHTFLCKSLFVKPDFHFQRMPDIDKKTISKEFVFSNKILLFLYDGGKAENI